MPQAYKRYFFSLDADVPIDSVGFLSSAGEAESQGGKTISQLAQKERLVLLVGPPYVGKTTALRSLAQSEYTSRILHSSAAGLSEQGPSGWSDFASNGGRTLWCVDGLDEKPSAANSILILIQGLTNQRRSDLSVLVSCRENEVPPDFVAQLGEMLAVKGTQVRIAPPDQLVAREICRDGADFSVIAEVVRSNNLRDLVGQPAALKWLGAKSRAGLQTVGAPEVWRGVIEVILEQWSRETSSEAKSTLVEQFKAASRVAFFLEFGECNSIQVGGSDVLAVSPKLDSLFPTSREGLAAAHEVVKSAFSRPRTAKCLFVIATSENSWPRFGWLNSKMSRFLSFSVTEQAVLASLEPR